jgi:VWFA-related protein/TonB family protein
MTQPGIDSTALSVLIRLAEPALRALGLAAIAGLTLRLLSVRRTSVKLCVWTTVLGAALAMPALDVVMPALPLRVLPATIVIGPAATTPKTTVVGRAVGLAEPSRAVASAAASERSATATPSTTRDVARALAADAGEPEARHGHLTPTMAGVNRAIAPTATSGGSVVDAAMSARAVTASTPPPTMLDRIPSSWPIALLVVYLLGALTLVTRAVVGAIATRRFARAATAVDDAATLARLNALTADARVARSPRLADSDACIVPLTMGIVRPAIVLPAGWREWSETTLDAVLIHELAHVARRDALTQSLTLIHRAIFWFSPLGWWLRRHLIQLAEYASDEAVLAGGVDQTTYAEALLGFFTALGPNHRRAEWSALGASGGHVAMAQGSGPERRVERIFAWTNGRSHRLTRAIAVATALGAMPTVAVVAAIQPARVAVDLPVVPAYDHLPRIIDAPLATPEPSVRPAATTLETAATATDGDVAVTVVVQDPVGYYIQGIQQDEWTLIEDGVPQTITSFGSGMVNVNPQTATGARPDPRAALAGVDAVTALMGGACPADVNSAAEWRGGPAFYYSLCYASTSARPLAGRKIELRLKRDGLVVTMTNARARADGSSPAPVTPQQTAPQAAAPQTPAALATPAADTGHRVVILLFDLTGMSTTEAHNAVDAALKWVDEKMTTSDLVAVASIDRKLQILSDFKNSASKIRDTVEAFRATAIPTPWAEAEGASSGVPTTRAVTKNVSAAELDSFGNDVRLRAIKTLCENMMAIQQKKAILYFSNGMKRNMPEDQTDLRAAESACVKSNTTINPVDTRGLSFAGPPGSQPTFTSDIQATVAATPGSRYVPVIDPIVSRSQVVAAPPKLDFSGSWKLDADRSTLVSLSNDNATKGVVPTLHLNQLADGMIQFSESWVVVEAAMNHIVGGTWTASPASERHSNEPTVRWDGDVLVVSAKPTSQYSQFAFHLDSDNAMTVTATPRDPKSRPVAAIYERDDKAHRAIKDIQPFSGRWALQGPQQRLLTSSIAPRSTTASATLFVSQDGDYLRVGEGWSDYAIVTTTIFVATHVDDRTGVFSWDGSALILDTPPALQYSRFTWRMDNGLLLVTATPRDAKAAPVTATYRRAQVPQVVEAFRMGAHLPTEEGATPPKLVVHPAPSYTPEAIREKVQGTVELECIVGADGTIYRSRITKSLDDQYGLDDQALKALAQWRFTPGTLNGQPVAFAVQLEMTFTLR